MKTSSRLITLSLILTLAGLILAGCGSVARQRSAARMPPGWSESSLEHDGLTRWYRIYLPEPLPEHPALVLCLHGGTLSMRSPFSPLADSTSTWFQIAEEEGVILLVPNGVNPENGDTYGDDQGWNDLRPDQAAGQNQADDAGFLLALLDAVSAELSVDEARIYVTGASNGGMMTYRMLLEAPDRFAAGAAFIANLPDLEGPLPTPQQPVPIMIANGTQDPLVPWNGGMVGKDRGEVVSTRETATWWVRANKADPSRMESFDLPDLNPEDGCRIRGEYYPAGEEGAPVLLYSVIGGGHTLPSLAEPGWFGRLAQPLLGAVCGDADGIRLAWDFFKSIETLP